MVAHQKNKQKKREKKKKKLHCLDFSGTSVVTWWLSTVPNPAEAPVLIPVCAGGFQALP